MVVLVLVLLVFCFSSSPHPSSCSNPVCCVKLFGCWLAVSLFATFVVSICVHVHIM